MSVDTIEPAQNRSGRAERSHRLARALIVYAWAAIHSNDPEGGASAAERCVELIRPAADSHLLATALITLAVAQAQQNRFEVAAAALKEAVTIAVQLRDGDGLAQTLNAAAFAASLGGMPRQALRIAGASEAVRSRPEFERLPGFNSLLNQHLDRARDVLGSDFAEAITTAGRELESDEAIAQALSLCEPKAALESLPIRSDRRYIEVQGVWFTRRELDIALLVGRGLTNREIARQLVLSERTVEGHVERVRERLTARSRTEVASWVASRGLLPR